MGHGKETPRQKMIGMMYLVLMAMLALNVSKDVLDAFAVLDKGLVSTLETLKATNGQIVNNFIEQEQINPAKVEEWRKKAQEVSNDANAIVDFIQEQKQAIVKTSEGEDTPAIDENGHIIGMLISGKDNTDIPANLMVGDLNDRAGKDIHNMFDAYREKLINTILASAPESIKHSIERSLNTDVGGHEEDGGHGGEGHTWESEHFMHAPLIGVISIMSGLQIQVRNAESEALRYLYSQIGAGDFKFNKIEATIIPNSNYIIKGNPYNAQVFLAASDSTSQPTIWVTTDRIPYDSTMNEDGIWEYSKNPNSRYDSLTVGKSGKGIFTQLSNSLGGKAWGGIIEMKGPTGTIAKPFKQSYTVAEGSVVVSPTKMNVFYLGVDNPIDVSVAGVQPDQIDVSISNGRVVKDRGNYIIRPKRPGNSYVIVSANVDGKKTQVGRKEFRVKTVPSPVAKVAGKTSGAIQKNVLMAQIGVVAEMENFDFDLTFTITEFTVSATVKGFTKDATSKSYRFTQEQKNIINSLSRGNRVYIQDIKAIGPDGSTRKLSTLNFVIN